MRPNILKKKPTASPRVFVYKGGKESISQTTLKSRVLKQRRPGKRSKRREQG